MSMFVTVITTPMGEKHPCYHVTKFDQNLRRRKKSRELFCEMSKSCSFYYKFDYCVFGSFKILGESFLSSTICVCIFRTD